jgi:flagellar M-ring protein FliF
MAVNGILQSLRNLGPMRLTGIAGAGVAVLAFIIFMMARLSSPPMEMLYGNLDLEDANQITKVLDQDKVGYELRAGGTQIWVPADQKLGLRVKLADQALPGGGSITQGYELFDKTDMLGSTAFLQNVNLLRAMEGELARTIRSIQGVKSARVHLVLPRREVFTREVEEPSASIVIKMEGARRLDKGQVQAIQHLVAAAVPKLKPERISIVDDKGTLLARGTGDEHQAMVENAEDLKLSTENRLQRTVEDLLEKSLGPDKVRAEITVDMDFDRVATTSETYDPDSRVVRSEVNSEDNNQTQDQENSSVSVQQNLPDAGANNPGARSLSKENRSQTTTNYEISKTTRNQVKEIGDVKRISAAVLVDGTYTAPEKGQTKLTYHPLDQKQLDQIATLVKSAIGFDAKRGDQVQVINMPFAGHDEIDQTQQEFKLFGFDREFVEKVASNLGLSIVAILFLLMVLRPLVSRAVEAMAAQAAEGRRLVGEAGGQALLAAGPPIPGAGMLPEDVESVDELIDIDKVEGRVKASSIRKIGEIVDKHPEEALSIIRAWMYQE